MSDLFVSIITIFIVFTVAMAIFFVENAFPTNFIHIAVYHDGKDRPLEPCEFYSFKYPEKLYEFMDNYEYKDNETLHFHTYAAANQRRATSKFLRMYVEPNYEKYKRMNYYDYIDSKEYYTKKYVKGRSIR